MARDILSAPSSCWMSLGQRLARLILSRAPSGCCWRTGGDARGPRGLRAQSGSIPEGKPGSLELGVAVSAESQVDKFQETPLLSTHLTNVCAH